MEAKFEKSHSATQYSGSPLALARFVPIADRFRFASLLPRSQAAGFRYVVYVSLVTSSSPWGAERAGTTELTPNVFPPCRACAGSL